MKSWFLAAAAILTVLFASVCARTQDATEKTRYLTVQAQVVARGLDRPRAIEAGPERILYVAEADGHLRQLIDGRLSDVATIDSAAGVAHEGIADMVLHPDFSSNGWIYFSYAVVSENGPYLRVARYTLYQQRLENQSVVFDGPVGDGTQLGGRMAFSSDGKLYVALGDGGLRDRAQDLDVLHGKVVRLNADGSIPSDNPFADTAGIRSEIFTFGHRHPRGIGVHPVSGKIYMAEHGPAGEGGAAGGGDEINVLTPGGNFGWPWVPHGMNQEGMRPPLRYYVPVLEPSGAAFYTGLRMPQWTNDFFVTSLRGQALIRIRFENGGIAEEEKLFSRKFGRLRDVVGGGEGYLHLLTENGEVIRVGPAVPAGP